MHIISCWVPEEKLVGEQGLTYPNNNAMILKMFFTGIGCFEGTFTLHMKEGYRPYQAPPRYVAMYYIPSRKSWKDHKRQQIIVPLEVEGSSKWYNSFILVNSQMEKFDYA